MPKLKKPFQCTICDFRCTFRKTIVLHIRTHNTNEIYVCEQCNFRTQDYQTYKKHRLNECPIEKPYQCTRCDLRFTTNAARNIHAKIHKTCEVYVCEKCKFRVNDYVTFRKHRLNGCVTAPKFTPRYHHCTQCNFKTTHVPKLVRHKHDKHPSCHCGYRCKTKDQLMKHTEETHTLQCTQCDFKTTHGPRLVRHKKDKHPVSCPDCDYRCKTKAQLMKHIGEKHTCENDECVPMNDPRNDVFTCPLCDYIDEDSNKLEVHIQKIHEINKPFACTICDFESYKDVELELHWRTEHTADKIMKHLNMQSLNTQNERHIEGNRIDDNKSQEIGNNKNNTTMKDLESVRIVEKLNQENKEGTEIDEVRTNLVKDDKDKSKEIVNPKKLHKNNISGQNVFVCAKCDFMSTSQHFTKVHCMEFHGLDVDDMNTNLVKENNKKCKEFLNGDLTQEIENNTNMKDLQSVWIVNKKNAAPNEKNYMPEKKVQRDNKKHISGQNVFVCAKCDFISSTMHGIKVHSLKIHGIEIDDIRTDLVKGNNKKSKETFYAGLTQEIENNENNTNMKDLQSVWIVEHKNAATNEKKIKTEQTVEKDNKKHISRQNVFVCAKCDFISKTMHGIKVHSLKIHGIEIDDIRTDLVKGNNKKSKETVNNDNPKKNGSIKNITNTKDLESDWIVENENTAPIGKSVNLENNVEKDDEKHISGQNVFECSKCDFISTSVYGVKVHCIQIHGTIIQNVEVSNGFKMNNENEVVAMPFNVDPAKSYIKSENIPSPKDQIEETEENNISNKNLLESLDFNDIEKESSGEVERKKKLYLCLNCGSRFARKKSLTIHNDSVRCKSGSKKI